MTRDLDSLLSAIPTGCEEGPNMSWAAEVTDDISSVENPHFQAFRDFVYFPGSILPLDILVEAKMMIDKQVLNERAKIVLENLSEFNFSEVDKCFLLACALAHDSTLLQYIPKDAPVLNIVWCLAQCVDADVKSVMEIWHKYLFHPPPIADRVACQAVLLLLEFCMTRVEPTAVPLFTSDEYETVFALAYCSQRSQVRKLASFILPQLSPLIIESKAAHLLFRRMLPYCAMTDKAGRRFATQVIAEILSDHTRFPSIVSTWITMHPFCVTASNNLLVDLQQKGLITTQMKNLIRQLMSMNKRVTKGKIKMTEDVKMSLPRSLWRVNFPPPLDEVKACEDTCRKISKSIESKRSVLWPVLMLFVVIYVLNLLI